MNLELVRFGHGWHSTLGELMNDGEHICWILEDQVQYGDKVPGQTRIPEGLYSLHLQRAGRIDTRYRERFPGMHAGTVMVDGVLGFEGIAIHIGNTHEDTEGCLLPGTTCHIDQDGEFTVGGSERAYRKLYPMITHRLRAGRPVSLRVRSRG